MKLPRAILPCLTFFAGGLLASYAVAWWNTYQFDGVNPQRGRQERLAPPTRWPIPTKPEWPPIDGVSENSSPFGHHLDQWTTSGITVRTYHSITKTNFLWIEEVRAGWPAPSASTFVQYSSPMDGKPGAPEVRRSWYGGLHVFDKTHALSFGTSLPEPVYFPLCPVWPGLLVNTAFYAATVFVATLFVHQIVRDRRARLGLCPQCKYPFGAAPVCTECGTPNPARPPASASGAA